MCNPNVNWLEKGRALLAEMCDSEETFTSLDFKKRLRTETDDRVYQADAGQFLRHSFVMGEMPGYGRRTQVASDGVEYLEYFPVPYDDSDDDYDDGVQGVPTPVPPVDETSTTLSGLWSQLRRKLGV